MTLYTIQVKNLSGVDKNMFIFAAPPVINGGEKVFSNVFLTHTIPAGGRGSFQFYLDLYAVCGAQAVTLESIITETESAPIVLGSPAASGTVLIMETSGDAAKFDSSVQVATAPPGTFIINTKDDFNEGDDYFVGLGSKPKGRNMDVSVLATIPACPNASFIVRPTIGYYIATGAYDPGQTIDVTVIGKSKFVEFTEGSNKIVVCYTARGGWICD